MRWGVLLLLFHFYTYASNVKSSIKTREIEDQTHVTATPVVNPIKFRLCIPFDPSILNGPDSLIKKEVITKFNQDFGQVRPAQILAVSTTNQVLYFGILGACQIYHIKLSSDLPSVAGRSYYLIVSKKLLQAALLPLDSFNPVKLKNSDSTSLVGGLFLLRGKGFYMIYRHNGRDGFDLVFNTSEVDGCEEPLPVYNRTLDCTSYYPFAMKLTIKDVDSDGVNDLVFDGNVLFFCRGLEYGYGREDRKPLKKKSVKIIFRAVYAKDTLSWRLTDNDICRILKKE
ncbi:MAG TPA: hypothetical protein VHD83_23195 [Puia sp.]|nr:hypothetical protein [Puia sp.]